MPSPLSNVMCMSQMDSHRHMPIPACQPGALCSHPPHQGPDVRCQEEGTLRLSSSKGQGQGCNNSSSNNSNNSSRWAPKMWATL